MTSQEKKFTGILATITLVVAGGLYVVANNAAGRYDAAKEQFDAAAQDINSMQSLPLFPTPENKAGKQKAVEEFQTNARSLISKLQAKRPKSMANTEPQAFTQLLVKTAKESKKRYADAGLKVEGEEIDLPKGFYLGFENYASTPAQNAATGILSYQLEALSEVHALLAAAKPTKLLNFHRESLSEERGEAYAKSSAGQPYRVLPFELSFLSSESCLRDFINGLQKSSQHFFVIRSMRVMNEKPTAPKSSDVNFADAETNAQADAEPASSVANFVLPDDSTPAAESETEKAPEVKDSSRILKQVLGNEQIRVFLRIDLVLFDEPVAANR